MTRLLILLLCLISTAARPDDWPQANHDAARTGRTSDEPRAPYRVAWAAQFPGEVIATRVEPIVKGGRIFVGTYSGKLRALGIVDGRVLWTAGLDGPILHSVAAAGGLCIAATAAGSVYGLKVSDGATVWRTRLGDHGFAAAPLVIESLAVIGSRGGTLCGLDIANGQVKWKLSLGAPIRTTAASDGKTVFVAAEDMRARAIDLSTGRLRWTSTPLPGQSLRDYYPVVARGTIVLRSNPAGDYAGRLQADRAALTGSAGIAGADWRALDAFLKSTKTVGAPREVAREQQTIRDLLTRDADSRTFHILDAATGRQKARAPILYAAGCQGVGIPPAVMADGRLAVLHRSLFSNWSLGVAPPLSVGIVDPSTGSLSNLRHNSGIQPPWNTFWGTADETTRLTLAGSLLLLSHQGTLASFDLRTRNLTHIAGARDTWGGYAGVPWARNEWHGPARGAVAVAGDRLFWISGSRVIAVRGGKGQGGSLPIPNPKADPAPSPSADTLPLPTVGDLAETLRAAPSVPRGSDDGPEGSKLDAAVAELLGESWAPLRVQPGLAGPETFFSRPSEKFDALLHAWPHLLPSLRVRVKAALEAEFNSGHPISPEGRYPLDRGRRRDWRNPAPPAAGAPAQPAFPLTGMHELWLYASTLREWESVQLRFVLSSREVFTAAKAKWKETLKARNEHTNRAVADMLAYARLASRFLEPHAEEARRMAAEGILELIAWMREFDPAAQEKSLRSIADLDEIIGEGDALFKVILPHKARIARLTGLTPELASILARYAPNRMRALFGCIDRMMPGWYLMGEERQVHFGENFMDYPDQALWIYTARAAAGFDSRVKLKAWLDMPFCRADLYDIQKRAIYLSLAPLAPNPGP